MVCCMLQAATEVPELQEAVAKLCIAYWQAKAPSRECVVAQLLPYLLVCALTSGRGTLPTFQPPLSLPLPCEVLVACLLACVLACLLARNVWLPSCSPACSSAPLPPVSHKNLRSSTTTSRSHHSMRQHDPRHSCHGVPAARDMKQTLQCCSASVSCLCLRRWCTSLLMTHHACLLPPVIS